jgi:DNA-binding GntR family transcriptional regulator
MNEHSGTLRVVPLQMRRLVEDGLRKAILDGRFKPGEHLPDRMLCELFGASRSVVREAVRLLEAEGLITVQPNRSPFVALISAAEASQIYEVRGVLEALAGEGFAVRATDAERDELRRVFDRLALMEPGAGQAALLAIKQEFYDILLRGCRNPLVARMLDQILNRNRQLRAMSLSDPGRLTHTIAEIRRVMDAIEHRDPEGAWDACRIHVRRAGAVALRILRERDAAIPVTDSDG